jgi:hypothetical protein
MRDGVTSVTDIGGTEATGIRADADPGVAETLREADERLRAMVCAYEENPSAIDNGVLNTGRRARSVEAEITGTFRLLQAKVYAEDSPIRADRDIWEAFREQRDEFAGFYRSALTALEAYHEVLQAYGAVKQRSQLPQPGDLERIRRDKHVHLEERAACIQAVSDFQRKFSAMIVVLQPVILP